MNTDFAYGDKPNDWNEGPTVLIIDDKEADRKNIRRICESMLHEKSFRLMECDNLPKAIEILSQTPIRIVLLDKNIGSETNSADETDNNGITAIPRFLQLQPQLAIIMVTGSNDIQDVVTAMTYGAFDYIPKEDLKNLLNPKLNSAIMVTQLKLDEVRTKYGQVSQNKTIKIPGKSAVIKHLVSQLDAVAESNRSVLIDGETGAGKRLAAKYIHQERQRFLKQKDRPFCEINLAACPQSLIESILFGHEPGSFTGALKQHQGIFETVNKGTLFLDEIAEINSDLQVKLLKVLDEKKFTRVGGKIELHTSFKLICATNKNLEEMVECGTFREDLYRRISTFVIRVPSLKEHTEDMEEIVEAVLPKCCQEDGIQVNFIEIPKDFIDFLKKNPPEGNFRGVEDQISRLLINSPKDKFGRRILKQWKSINDFRFIVNENKTTLEPLTYKDIAKSPFNVLGPDFPGLSVFLDLISKKIIQEASSKFKKNVEIASALKISAGAVSQRMKSFDSSQKNVARKAIDTVKNIEKLPNQELQS